jgi:DHA1 family bicyclomycin/chloramphenicol resistance-like MFS transporter
VAVVETVQRRPTRRSLVPGTFGFMFVLAMCMAVTALGVDSVLPAFPHIRRSLGLAPDAVEVTRLISFYLLGASLGLLPAGIMSDKFGRRPVMWGGLTLYVVGAVGSVLAPTLGWMFVARFVWGLGAAGPRVASTAAVRDSYEGEQMARQMSFIMAVFILVPTFAPTLSSLILHFGPWQAVFWVCAALAVGVAGGVTRLPETLHTDDRRTLSRADVGEACRIVLRTPGTIAYLVSLTAMFGVFTAFLASSQVVIDQVFGLESWFPLYFGGLSIVMGLGMLANGRLVERVGLDRMIGRVFLGSFVAVVGLAALALVTGGKPPFWAFVGLLACVLFAHQMLIPNLNSAAMRPLSQVAGTAAAIIGMVSGAGGAMLGGLIDSRFDGTVTPLAVSFVIASAVAATAWWRARTAGAAG